MSAGIDLIYCANGNGRYAQIAIDAGFKYGARLPGTVYHPVYFADHDFKQPDGRRYIEAVIAAGPKVVTVHDIFTATDLDIAITWAEQITAAIAVDALIFTPKLSGIIPSIPHRIGGALVRLGYSVPTKYGGTELPVWEFSGWPVHLLGGSPHAQRKLAHYMDVVSVDGNMANKMASRYCAFWSPVPAGKYGHWPTIDEFDGRPWLLGNANYEAFRRSCENIYSMWTSLTR